MEQNSSQHDAELQALFESQDVDDLNELAKVLIEGSEGDVGQTFSLALVHYTLFQKGESVESLDRAINYGQQALIETPMTHPDRVFRLRIVTEMMLRKAQINESQEDSDVAYFLLQQTENDALLHNVESQQSSRYG